MNLSDDVKNARYNMKENTEDLGDKLKDKTGEIKQRFSDDGEDEEEKQAM